MLKRNLKLCLILATSLIFAGCKTCEPAPPCKPKIVIKKEIVYLNQTIPPIKKAPKMLKYKMKFLQLNKKDYYIMTLQDGDIMLSNWKRYNEWSKSNYKILKRLGD